MNLVYSPRGVAYGASYTDIHVTLLFYKVLIVACLIAAVVIFISVLKSKVKANNFFNCCNHYFNCWEKLYQQ